MKIDSTNGDVNRSSNKIVEANQSKLVFDQLYCFFLQSSLTASSACKSCGARVLESIEFGRGQPHECSSSSPKLWRWV